MPQRDARARLVELGAGDDLLRLLLVPGASQNPPEPTRSEFERWAAEFSADKARNGRGK